MSTLTELAFESGDLKVVEVAPGIFDLATVSDNEAIVQDALINLNLQKGHNLYFTSTGWSYYRHLKGSMSVDDVHEIIKDVKALFEDIDFVDSAEVTYEGSTQVGSQYEHAFTVSAVTAFGPLVLPFAVGGLPNA